MMNLEGLKAYFIDIDIVELIGSRMYRTTLVCGHSYLTDEHPFPGKLWCEHCWVAAGRPLSEVKQ